MGHSSHAMTVRYTGEIPLEQVKLSFGFGKKIVVLEKMGRSLNPFNLLEREKGIEPSFLAWEASVLPLNHSRDSL